MRTSRPSSDPKFETTASIKTMSPDIVAAVPTTWLVGRRSSSVGMATGRAKHSRGWRSRGPSSLQLVEVPPHSAEACAMAARFTVLGLGDKACGVDSW